ncbi:MAG: HAD family hydrolase [Planctomycetota bacterium]|nr:MAG: HAD family hydrolase [Planctomycetota bacterium]
MRTLILMAPTHQLSTPIRTITFDWGDTLVANYGMPYGFVHQRALHQLTLDLQASGALLPPDWEASCAQQLHTLWVESAQPDLNPEQREFDYDALITSWLDAVNCQRGRPEIDAAVATYAATITDTICPFLGVLETLRGLKDLGLRIGVLSHVPWPGWACRAWWQRKGWAPYVDFYSLSSDVGFIKPHPAHYQHALDQAGCAAAEILHVGDHPERDVVGGKAFGFQCALKVTQGIYEDSALLRSEPHIAIAHVQELLELFRAEPQLLAQP